MNEVDQLELPLWHTLKEATQSPAEADLSQIWQLLDGILAPLSPAEKLRIVAEAIAQITHLFHERSRLTFEDLQAIVTDDGPVMTEDAFDCYVRQSMQVDFEQFIEAPDSPPRKPPERRSSAFPDDGSSAVGLLDKDALLEALAHQEEQEFEPSPTDLEGVLELAHEEDVSGWVSLITEYMNNHQSDRVGLNELQDALPLPFIEIWLGLLLGGFALCKAPLKSNHSQDQDLLAEEFSDWFYHSEILVESNFSTTS